MTSEPIITTKTAHISCMFLVLLLCLNYSPAYTVGIKTVHSSMPFSDQFHGASLCTHSAKPHGIPQKDFEGFVSMWVLHF